MLCLQIGAYGELLKGHGIKMNNDVKSHFGFVASSDSETTHNVKIPTNVSIPDNIVTRINRSNRTISSTELTLTRF